MDKYYGTIGFASSEETEPGIWEEKITERNYCGDVVRNTRRLQTSGSSVNDNVIVSNQISIVADPYAQLNFHAIRYATFMGAKWKITEVDVQYPRLILTMGDVYNGEQA